jgi:ketol-acid reductoisomerase
VQTINFTSELGPTLVIGFGSQGKAQAQNLRDRGVDVSVFLRPGSLREAEVRALGIACAAEGPAAVKLAQTAVLLIPDAEQPSYYQEVLAPHLPSGAAVVFAHGYNLQYRRIFPRRDLDVLLVAPLAHGDAVRRDWLTHGAVPCVTAVAQDATGRAHERATAYAAAICGAGPLIASTVAEEVETDLFAEQAVLCGGVPELVHSAFETLRDAGYQEEIAYHCCLRELRAIVELLWHHSIAGMRERVSATARYGAVTRGPRIIDASVRTHLEEILAEIRSGAFAQEFTEEQRRGFPLLTSRAKEDAEHPLERVHRALVARR